MEYRMFGKSGLKVSALGYGCMTFGDPSNGNVRPRTS
jgi:aryl-alcohol dehydrogenase-like predicted oxidoreductase